MNWLLIRTKALTAQLVITPDGVVKTKMDGLLKLQTGQTGGNGKRKALVEVKLTTTSRP